MAEKFDKLVKIGEEVCKKEFTDYENKYREFVTSYTKAIALTATYSAVSGGKSWPKEFFKDSPNPTTFGELFKWMFDKDYGSRYYDQKDVVGESESVYLDPITGKEYKTRVEAAGRVPLAPEKEGDKGLPDDIIEAAIVGNEEIKQIYASLRKNYRDTQNYLTYKKILQEITISVYSEKVVKQYLERVTSEGIRTWTLDKFLEIWRDGLQGKNSMQSDVGIADFVGREYPLYQEVYGGNFWAVIDNPWSARKNAEGPQTLVDAIREKSSDPAANNALGTSASEAEAAKAAGDDAAKGMSSSTPLKYIPFVDGLADGFQIDMKVDLPDFKIYVGDPESWKELDAVDPDGQQLDENGEPDEYTEEKYDERYLDLDIPSDSLEKALLKEGLPYTEEDRKKEQDADNGVILKIEGRIPVRASDADTLWKQLEKYYGEKEVPAGSNKGTNITRFLKDTGLGSPAPWCMAFVYSNFKEFTNSIGQKNMLKKTASCMNQWQATPKDCQILAKLAAKNPNLVRGGQVFIKSRDGGGHTGIVLKRDGNTHFYSIDGNSGDMVRLNRYKISNMLGFIEYFSNDAFQSRFEELATTLISTKSFASGGKET